MFDNNPLLGVPFIAEGGGGGGGGGTHLDLPLGQANASCSVLIPISVSPTHIQFHFSCFKSWYCADMAFPLIDAEITSRVAESEGIRSDSDS